MDKLSLEEITDWKEFENLVAGYFRTVKDDNEFNVLNVLVEPTGSGSDGGRDILVIFTVDDSIMTFERKWVVQCKFREDDVNKSHLADINIPSLLHQYGADGYLLVCKQHYTSPVSDMLEGFNKECPFRRSYHKWNGSDLLQRVRLKENLVEHFFPKYSIYIKNEEKRMNEKLDENQ